MSGFSDDIMLYSVSGKVATITFNRPKQLNAIVDRTGSLLQELVAKANDDPAVHVILLTASKDSKGFCGGYDLYEYAEKKGSNAGYQAEMPWDPVKDYQNMMKNTKSFMSLWRSLKPVICKVWGAAVGGGSDIALCCDLIVCGESARFGYPPARVWGVPTTSMWVYRLGAERAKRLMLTGDVIDGMTAHRIGLVTECAPESDLDRATDALVQKVAALPINQLIMHKLVVNQTYDNMGLGSTQTLATFLDGVARHTPEGVRFKQRAEAVGWKAAVAERDGPKRKSKL